MWWNRIVNWFSSLGEKNRCINDFNSAAQTAFVTGVAPVYLKAEQSRGNSNYKHSMSSWFYSGFRINTLSGRTLTTSEVRECGMVIATNQELMRKLATLGFDTLEICDQYGRVIQDWRIAAIMQIGY